MEPGTAEGAGAAPLPMARSWGRRLRGRGEVARLRRGRECCRRFQLRAGRQGGGSDGLYGWTDGSDGRNRKVTWPKEQSNLVALRKYGRWMAS